jgi:hypothetical protein
MKEMALVAQRLADPEGNSALEENTKNTKGGGGGRGGERTDGQIGGLAQVSVNYERLHEFASFQLTSAYTFEQLCSDCCRYWGIKVEYGTLRDAHNVMWPPQAVISDLLESRKRMDGETPLVKLVVRSGGDNTNSKSKENGNKDDFLSNNKTSTFKNSGSSDGSGSSSNGGVGPDDINGMNFDDDSDEEDDEEDESMSLIKEWRRMLTEELSPLFHLPRYAGQKSKFRSLSSNSGSSKILADTCTTCCKLTFHVLFLVMTTLCLFYRRRVVTSYDASHSLKAALLEAKYLGDNFTSTPLPITFQTMRTTDEFWGWMEGPMLVRIKIVFICKGTFFFILKTYIIFYNLKKKIKNPFVGGSSPTIRCFLNSSWSGT